MSGMLSELGNALDGATEVNYDSESDTYSVTTTNDTYGKVTYSYDIENNTLNNYSLESNEGNVYIEFKELEKEEFEETYRAIYSTVQKAKENSTTETNEK